MTFDASAEALRPIPAGRIPRPPGPVKTPAQPRLPSLHPYTSNTRRNHGLCSCPRTHRTSKDEGGKCHCSQAYTGNVENGISSKHTPDEE